MTISRVFSLILLAGISFSLCAYTPGDPIRGIKTTEKVIALTFDDGPEPPYTEKILDVLDKNQVKATFFVLGGNAKAYPQLIERIMKDGHDLGNHTMSHSMMKNKPVEVMQKDIASVDEILRGYGYKKDISFRAPHGGLSPNLKTALHNLNKQHVLFNFLPQDWTKISAQEIYDNCMKQLKPGLIITLHDGGKRRDNTVIATEMLIKNLKEQGYRFVTVSELLAITPTPATTTATTTTTTKTN